MYIYICIYIYKYMCLEWVTDDALPTTEYCKTSIFNGKTFLDWLNELGNNCDITKPHYMRNMQNRTIYL